MKTSYRTLAALWAALALSNYIFVALTVGTVTMTVGQGMASAFITTVACLFCAGVCYDNAK